MRRCARSPQSSRVRVRSPVVVGGSSIADQGLAHTTPSLAAVRDATVGGSQSSRNKHDELGSVGSSITSFNVPTAGDAERRLLLVSRVDPLAKGKRGCAFEARTPPPKRRYDGRPYRSRRQQRSNGPTHTGGAAPHRERSAAGAGPCPTTKRVRRWQSWRSRPAAPSHALWANGTPPRLHLSCRARFGVRSEPTDQRPQ